MKKIRAALAHANRSPLSIEDIELSEPQADDVLVRITSTGLCHTDLMVLDEAPLPWPAVLGHEGCGIVEQVGANVQGLVPGDTVVTTSVSCGMCSNCLQNQPSYCEKFRALNMSGGYRADGTCSHCQGERKLFGRFLGQSSFATHALVHQRSVIKVDANLPLEQMAPLGCGIQTGAGAVLNTLKPRMGSTLAIFGAGAVGLAALMAGKLGGCSRLILVDRLPSRLALGLELGATDIIDASQVDSVAAIRELTGGGVDGSVEATGVPAVMSQAIAALGLNGCAVLVGLASPQASVAFNPTELQSRRQSIKGSMMAGDGASPQVFIPELIAHWRAGRFPFDKLSKFYAFEDINQAIADARSGSAIKPVLRMAH